MCGVERERTNHRELQRLVKQSRNGAEKDSETQELTLIIVQGVPESEGYLLVGGDLRVFTPSAAPRMLARCCSKQRRVRIIVLHRFLLHNQILTSADVAQKRGKKLKKYFFVSSAHYLNFEAVFKQYRHVPMARFAIHAFLVIFLYSSIVNSFIHPSLSSARRSIPSARKNEVAGRRRHTAGWTKFYGKKGGGGDADGAKSSEDHQKEVCDATGR